MRDELNSYKSPTIDSAESPRSRHRRIAKRQFSAPRVVLLSILAVVASFLLLEVWAWTAQFPWSGDWWLIIIPAGIVIAGMLALAAIVIIILRRLS